MSPHNGHMLCCKCCRTTLSKVTVDTYEDWCGTIPPTYEEWEAEGWGEHGTSIQYEPITRGRLR